MAIVEVEPHISLHYTEVGKGPGLLYLHGVLGSSRYFSLQQQNPVADMRSVFLDFRGHGQSPDPLRGHSVSQYALDVARVLDVLELSPVVLIGWSMGALVAWEYLSIFGPAKLRGLIAVDQSPSDFAFPGWPYGNMTEQQLRSTQQRIQKDPEQQASENAAAIFHQPTAIQKQVAMAEFLRVNRDTAYSIFSDQTLRDYRKTIENINLPVQLCFGRDPSVVSPEAGAFMAKSMPNARLTLFNESSHCPFWEEPEKFAQVIAEFVCNL